MEFQVQPQVERRYCQPEPEAPSAEAGWYLLNAPNLVRLKLKLHRLKPDGIFALFAHTLIDRLIPEQRTHSPAVAKSALRN